MNSSPSNAQLNAARPSSLGRTVSPVSPTGFFIRKSPPISFSTWWGIGMVRKYRITAPVKKDM